MSEKSRVFGGMRPSYAVLERIFKEAARGDARKEAALASAFEQASARKGAERHASGRDFEDQPIMVIQRRLRNDGFALGQAAKKLQECERLRSLRAVEELRGAAVYLGAAIMLCDSGAASPPLEDLAQGPGTRAALRAIEAAVALEKPAIRRIQIMAALREVADLIGMAEAAAACEIGG